MSSRQSVHSAQRCGWGTQRGTAGYASPVTGRRAHAHGEQHRFTVHQPGMVLSSSSHQEEAATCGGGSPAAATAFQLWVSAAGSGMRKSSRGATTHQRGTGGRRCDNGMAVLWYLEGLSGGSESTFEVGWCCTTYARGWKGGEMSCPRWTMVAEIDAPQLGATLGPLHATSPSPKLPLAGVMPPLRHPLDELACRPLPPSFLVLRQVSKLLLNVQDLAEDPPNTNAGRHRCTGAVHGEPHPPPSSSQSDAPLPDPPCLASVPHLREASDEDRC
jgi:hypothetical protein